MNFLELFSKYHKFIIIIFLALAAVAFLDKTLAVGILFAVFLVSLTLFLLERSKNKKRVRILSWLFLIALLIHLAVVLFIHYANFLPFSGGSGDFFEYNSVAQSVSSRIHQANFYFKDLPVGGHNLSIIFGYIYAFTAPQMLIGQIFNAWVVALIIIFVYLIVRELGRSEKEGFLAGLVVAFYPSLAFYGSLLLKEPLSILFCIIGLFLTLKMIKNFSWSKFLVFYAAMIPATHFRFYTSYAVVLAFIICWLFFSSLPIKRRLFYWVVMILLLGFLPQISKGQRTGQNYFAINGLARFINPQMITYYREKAYLPKNIEPPPIEVRPYRQEQSTAPKNNTPSENNTPSGNNTSKELPDALQNKDWGEDSTVIVKAGLGSPIMFIKNTLLSFVYCLLGPFPWQMTQLKHFFALPEIIAWYFLLFFIIKGAVKSFRKQYKVILPLIIFAFITLGVMALFLSNYGIITRIRMPAFIALVCLFPLGFERLKNVKIPYL